MSNRPGNFNRAPQSMRCVRDIRELEPFIAEHLATGHRITVQRTMQRWFATATPSGFVRPKGA